MITVLRRLFWMALLGGAGFAGWTAWQRRSEVVGATGTPVWPPFEPATAAPGTAPDAAPDAGSDTVPDAPSEPEPPAAAAATFADVSAATDVTAAADPTDGATDDGSTDAAHAHPARWVPPVDGRCPDGYPIKANDNSGIFHVPGGRFYERTVPERCYADAADAEADGYRRAKA